MTDLLTAAVITGVPNLEESIKYINDLCTRIERDVNVLSSRCAVSGPLRI